MDTTSRTQPSRTARQPIVSLVAVLAVVLLAAGTPSGSANTRASRIQNTFGCAGTMVISNTDCEMGVANAYDNSAIAAISPALGASRCPMRTAGSYRGSMVRLPSALKKSGP